MKTINLTSIILIIICSLLFFACGDAGGAGGGNPGGGSDPKGVPVITINTHPAATTNVIYGSINGSLNVIASVTESASLSYEWYSNVTDSYSGATPTGETGESFTIPQTLTLGKHYYFCEISVIDGDALVRSNVATVSVSLIDMELIAPGTFMMGSPATESGRTGDPAEIQHSVTLTKGFYMGKYVVTQLQWQTIMGKTIVEQQALTTTSTADYGRGANYPIYWLNWYDALVFCNKLSISEGLSPAYSINNSTDPVAWGTVPDDKLHSDVAVATWNGVVIIPDSNGYRLPTEAQWEYACRAGTTTAYNTGSDSINDNTGWYTTNSGNKTHEVGLKAVNAWGLFDMHGNVLEWCWGSPDDYTADAQTDPVVAPGYYNTLRGGAYGYSAASVRSASRRAYQTWLRSYDFSFRVIRPK